MAAQTKLQKLPHGLVQRQRNSALTGVVRAVSIANSRSTGTSCAAAMRGDVPGLRKASW